MRTPFTSSLLAVAIVAVAASVFAAEGATSPYTDASGDISSNISGGNPGNGTLDILGMEVSTFASDLVFKLTVNGDISTTDWGNYMIGIGSYNDPLGTITGNPWTRPINLQYTPDGFPTAGGMDYWIGSWVNGGGGSQLWTWDGTAWNGPAALAGFSLSPGATSDIFYTVSLASLGLSPGNQFTFDAYSSGANGNPGAIDALANPNVTVNDWGDSYTSKPVAFGGGGLNSFTVPVPEPSTMALAVMAIAGGGLALSRRTRRL